MAKSGGNKGGFMDNPFGGFFDFDGDGKEDLGELWIAYQIFCECTEQEYLKALHEEENYLRE